MANEMNAARAKLERELNQHNIPDALSVLDKAVSGLIDLAKSGTITDKGNLQGKILTSPFGKEIDGGSPDILRMGKRGLINPEKFAGVYNVSQDVEGSSNKRKGKHAKNQQSTALPKMGKAMPGGPPPGGPMGGPPQGGPMGGPPQDGPPPGGEDDEGGDIPCPPGIDPAMWAKLTPEQKQMVMQELQRRMQSQQGGPGGPGGPGGMGAEDEEDDGAQGADDGMDPEDGMGAPMGKAMYSRDDDDDDEDEDDDYDDEEDEDEDEDEEDDADGDGIDDEDEEDDEDQASRLRAMARARAKKKNVTKKSFSPVQLGDIHKALVDGPDGARVAEVVEASKELAQMVNVFGRFLSDISEQVEAVREEQYQSTAMLANAVSTVVKSQAALALGLERMAKSTAALAQNGGTLNKSFANGGEEMRGMNPGVLMNGKVLIEGQALRKANVMIDDTGRAIVDGTDTEQRLTKSLVGSIIQQSVLDGEFSPKEALRWLTETDSPTTGPVGVFKQLPPKLQERILNKSQSY